MLSDLEHIQLAEEKVRRFITLAEEILRLHEKTEQRINEGYRNEYFKPTLRNRVIAGLAVKAGRSFERLIVDARNRRGECAHHLKTMVECFIYACWVSGDETEKRASLLQAESFRSRAAYHENCSASPEDEDAHWAKEWRELQHKQIKGIEKEWKNFPSLESIAADVKSKDLYNIYRASCEAAHTGDLPLYMPPQPTEPGLTLADLSLQQCYVSLQSGVFLACELLRNASDQVELELESEIDSFAQRSREIRLLGT